jgi:FMN phosphatase YigB (HAD superfamily)
MQDKVIITDADGVLVDWFHSFSRWMTKRGYRIMEPDAYQIDKVYGIIRDQGKRLVREFNESADIAFLTPHLDAIKYVKKLHEEHGYVFHVVTSQSDNINAQNLRIQNLKNLFGETVFEEFSILDTGADKDEALLKYKDTGCWWVEDKPENAEVGVELGLEGILMEHNHNKDYLHADIKTAKNWKEVYEIITGS